MKTNFKIYFERQILNTEIIKVYLLQLENKSREFICERLICTIKSIFPGIKHTKTHTAETILI